MELDDVKSVDHGNKLAAEVSREFLAKFGKLLVSEQRYQRGEFSCRFALADGKDMRKEEINWLEVRLTLSGFEAPPEGMAKP